MELEKKLENNKYKFGPNTAGLAQRMYIPEADKEFYTLKKAYIPSCSVNQF